MGAYTRTKRIIVNLSAIIITVPRSIINFLDGRILHMAVKTGHENIVKFLITDIDVDIKVNDQWTALHTAASSEKCQASMFELLLKKFADPNAKTRTLQETPLHILLKCERRQSASIDEIIILFSKYICNLRVCSSSGTLFQYAIRANKVDALRTLLICREALNSSKSYETTKAQFSNDSFFLLSACKHTDLPTAKFFVENGAEVNESMIFWTIKYIEIKNWWRISELVSEGMKLLRYILSFNTKIQASLAFTLLNDNNLPDFLWQTFLKHLAKLRKTKNLIDSGYFQLVLRDPVYGQYFKLCDLELEVLINTKPLSNSWVTFFAILAYDKKKPTQFATNLDLIKYFAEKNSNLERFPIYGDLIYDNFIKAVEYGKIWKHASNTLKNLFPKPVDRDHLVVLKIISYLNLYDLRKFSEE